MLSCHLQWKLLQSLNNNVRVLFVDVKKLYKLIFCLRSKALSRISSLHKGGFFGKNTAIAHLNGNQKKKKGKGGGGALKTIPFFVQHVPSFIIIMPVLCELLLLGSRQTALAMPDRPQKRECFSILFS